ncbi:MAG: hypothetical protein ACFB4I_17580 [Cyanophyceae cyanobacterium]
MHPNSLANLEKGASARFKGKQQITLTLMPDVVQWLKRSGNASQRVEDLVAAARSGRLKPEVNHD